jgi:hypothetical protein
MSYNLVLPTSVEPQNGWSANDRAVFLLNNPNQSLRKGTVRLNGLFQVWRSVSNGVPVRIDASDKIMLNPNAGISGIIRQIQTKLGPSTVETINDYGKLIALKNEAKYFQIDQATTTDSMLELMTFSNDDYTLGDDFKTNILQGLKFPIDTDTSELPFSLDLDICINSSVDNIPFSRLGEVELSIIFQDIGKTGLVARGNVPNASYSYYLKNLEIRYMTEMDNTDVNGAIVLEIKNEAHVPTILNKTSALEFAPTNAFDSVVCGFLTQSHDSTATNLVYDYLASEAIREQIEYLEIKVNGRDDFLKYPLRFQTSEILYNYLLAWSPYIHAYDDLTVKKHGLTYTKLGNETPTGFGMGIHLYGGLEAGTRISFNLTLKNSPATPYRCFFFTLGKLML